MDGLLLVDKPKDWTSFDVVAKVRGIIQTERRRKHVALGTCMEGQNAEAARSADVRTGKHVNRASQHADNVMASNASGGAGSASTQRCRCKIRVGHTGTLDPCATGLLVLCIGKYTKKVPEMIRHDKTYEVELTLGATSTTGDQEGAIVPSSEFRVPSRLEIDEVIHDFVGEQLHTPPAFSAIKVDGKRAYDLARAGKEVKIEPRKITIHTINNVRYDWPRLSFTCKVSSGTYIRSLAVDIGEKLGCGAYMSELRRTEIDKFALKDAISLEGISYEVIKSNVRT